MPIFTISSQPTNLTIDQPSPNIKLYTNGAITFDGGPGNTDLTYTPSPTQGQVNSSTGTDAVIPATDGTNAGLFLPAQKSKLDSITAIFTTALQAAYDATFAWISTNGTFLLNHASSTSNPHSTTQAQVGLANVDNTSDLNKPISTATQTALTDLANQSIINALIFG